MNYCIVVFSFSQIFSFLHVCSKTTFKKFLRYFQIDFWLLHKDLIDVSIHRYLNIHCSLYEGNIHQNTGLLNETSKSSHRGLNINVVFGKLWYWTYPKFITNSIMSVNAFISGNKILIIDSIDTVLWSTIDMQCLLYTLSFTFLVRHSRAGKWYNNLHQIWSICKKKFQTKHTGKPSLCGLLQKKDENKESFSSTCQWGRCSFPSPGEIFAS